VSLTAAIACAVTAGNIARELSEQGEIEEIKKRAITADVVDEISTSAYISQQQRQQEAELILTSPGLMWKKAEKRWKLYTATTYKIVLPFRAS
jgi:hypothetical protein